MGTFNRRTSNPLLESGKTNVTLPRSGGTTASIPSITITDEFQTALDLLHAGKHLFLTGKAGTGKSTLIRHYVQSTNRRTITVAPTGIAALNVDGYTIHRLFSFRSGVDEDFVRSAQYRPQRFARVLSSLETLIIDEASMVRADLFDAVTAALERFGPNPGAPMGGVQVVLVGDLYQLPPVVTEAEAAWIEANYSTPFFFSAHSFDPTIFPLVQLSTVFRQLNDDRLVSLLNDVREGELLESARTELNKRANPDFEPQLDEFWLTLATTNRIVSARNRQMLDKLPNPSQAFTATIEGEIDGFDHPTDNTLELAVGAQVMLLNNDPARRWVNGTLGKVTAMDIEQDGPVISVLLRNGHTEQVREHTWEITRPIIRGGSLEHERVGAFTQLPLKLAWAITIHKSQGQTLDRVVVDLTGGTFANGQLYVALSRCTSLEGLVLRREVQPRDLKSDIRVRRYLATGKPVSETRGEAYLAVLTVGTAGRQWRPRPVEIAVVTDDGDEVTTVINPTSDLYSAKADYSITARDVQLAPLLTEAWPALSSVLAGRVPVGLHVDEQLSHIDFELKRNDIVEPIPLGIDLYENTLRADELSRLSAPSALERAHAVRDTVRRVRRDGGGLHRTGTAFPPSSHGRGYLLSRTTGPAGTTEPTGFVVGGTLSSADRPEKVLADLLRQAWDRVPQPDHAAIARLRSVEQHFGVSILPDTVEANSSFDIETALTPGAHVCFSGSVISATRGVFSKDELHQLAQSRNLVAVQSLTKTKTDVLIVSEMGSQSKKAKDAAKWGKPVFEAEEFLKWAEGK
ncbi:AAA family ATPase [Gordonia jinhuaensis]|uniref:AAA+ ATPase domain-containing protein n=1 Tax=Gordonia jinhuaensis TaxID=1517702 RepID=A0A916THZ7_9ACTN|nr:AAA family ATPase [Gordonia jinhuaensis]GGB43933.1 hypothetical protein GCM10011489_34330 [Gordonia jinhuaensis]